MTREPVHVSKWALCYLAGLDSSAYASLPMGQAACGDSGAVYMVAVGMVLRWQNGQPLSLPTCPQCAVLWDAAVEACRGAPASAQDTNSPTSTAQPGSPLV